MEREEEATMLFASELIPLVPSLGLFLSKKPCTESIK
jgi:hypothetical protein